MPTEVLNQLRVLRESIADALRKDPRYLTLAALDKSIAEISGVLNGSGEPASHPAPRAPLQFETAAPPHATDKPSMTRPLAETAALVTAGGVATEVVHQATAEAEPQTPATEAESGPTEDDGDSDDAEPEPAGHVDEPEPETDRHEPDPDLASHHEPIAVADLHAEGTTSAPAESDVDTYDSIPQAKASGYVPMQARPGVAQYQPGISVKFGRLPTKVDLRPLMSPVENQGDTSSCVACAVAAAYDYWVRRVAKQDAGISRLFVYYNARWRDDSQDRDSGSVIQFAIDGLKSFGACQDAVWPFDKDLVLQRPGAEAYKDAAPLRLQDMAQVPIRLEAWKQALAEGKPIVFGCLLFETFDDCSDRGGVVPMPSPAEAGRQTHGGHAMCAVGYCDSEKVFIVRNSWGADWGDHGYCYMPYAYLMNPTFNDGDSWVFASKSPAQAPREAWSDGTAPVTAGGKGVDFPIEPHTIAEYAGVAIDYFEKWRKPYDAAINSDFADYASLSGKGSWSEMESFDVDSFLATNAALTGISALVTSEFSSAPQTGESPAGRETLGGADTTGDDRQGRDH